MKLFDTIIIIIFAASINYSQWVQTFTCGDDNINDIIRAGNYLFAATDYNGVWRSSDDGTSWTKIDNGLTESFHEALIYVFNKLMVGSSSGIFQSTNYGTNWTKLENTGFDWYTVNYLLFDGTTLFVATFGNGIYKSTDGINFTEINSGLPTTYLYNLVLKGSKLFAGTSGYGVYVTTNSGTVWTSANSGIDSRSVRAFISHNNSLFIGSTYGIYRSNDDGNSWSQVSSMLEAEAFASTGNYLFSGNYIDGIWCSSDNGSNWVNTCTTSGPTDQTIKAILIDNGYIHTGDEEGKMYRIPLSQLTYADDLSFTDFDFSLEQNYPNPFNPSTIISYQLSVPGNVTLKLYDILGNEVAVLINNEWQEAGRYNHQFSIDNSPNPQKTENQLQSGVYFYKLQAGNFSAIKKLMVIK